MNAVAVNLQQTVAHHQAVLAFVLKALVKTGNGRCDDFAVHRAGQRNQQNEKTGQKVHGDAANQNQKPPRAAGSGERTRGDRAVVAVLTLHHARAANWQKPQKIPRFSKLVRPQRRAHANPELINAHAAALGGDQMTAFVYQNEHAERQ